MITRRKIIPVSLPDDRLLFLLNQTLKTELTLDQFLWFDIETTGLSAKHCPLYLIGCVRKESCGFVRYQFMTESADDEENVLRAFLALCDEATCLVQFNGDTFDVPYVRERCHQHGLTWSSDRLIHLDMLKKIRPWRNLLGLSGCRQKDLEKYLGIFREDKYNGGELIQIYYSFERFHRDDLYDLLILHNGDDMDGMMELCRLLAIPLFFDGEFSLTQMEKARYDGNLPGELILTCTHALPIALPRTIALLFSDNALRAEETRLTLRIPIYHGTLKHFYPNYRDYYYLPDEDCAIHKSVGEFVDRAHRVKATAATCYTKMTGTFLRQPSVIYSPALYETHKGSSVFFPYEDGCFSDPVLFNQYLQGIISLAKSGKE